MPEVKLDTTKHNYGERELSLAKQDQRTRPVRDFSADDFPELRTGGIPINGSIYSVGDGFYAAMWFDQQPYPQDRPLLRESQPVHLNAKIQRLESGDLMCAWFVNKTYGLPPKQPFLFFNPDSWEVRQRTESPLALSKSIASSLAKGWVDLKAIFGDGVVEKTVETTGEIDHIRHRASCRPITLARTIHNNTLVRNDRNLCWLEHVSHTCTRQARETQCAFEKRPPNP
jgi:hypothetical protein